MGQQVGNVAQNDVGVITGTKGFTDRQKMFVRCYKRNGCDETAAAKSAGYSDPDKSGWELMQLPHIIAAIKRHYDKELCGSLAALSLKFCREVLESKRKDKDMLLIKARVAKQIIDRARIGAPEHDPADAAKPMEKLTKSELMDVIDKWERVKENKAIDLTAEVVVGK